MRRVEIRLINIVPFVNVYFEVPKVPTLTLSELAELRDRYLQRFVCVLLFSGVKNC